MQSEEGCEDFMLSDGRRYDDAFECSDVETVVLENVNEVSK